MIRSTRCARVWLFEQCSPAEMETLALATMMVDVPAGKVLAREGDLGREFLVIVSGTVEVTRNGVRVGVLGPEDFFGEMALLGRRPRSATVTALEPASILVLAVGAFMQVVSTMPSVDRKMLAVLADRIRDLEDRFLPVDGPVTKRGCTEHDVTRSLTAVRLVDVRETRPELPIGLATRPAIGQSGGGSGAEPERCPAPLMGGL